VWETKKTYFISRAPTTYDSRKSATITISGPKLGATGGRNSVRDNRTVRSIITIVSFDSRSAAHARR